MDPVSAVGLASSIIAFIDFSWELVAGTWEIYRSLDGTSDENARLEDVIGDLESLSQSLQAQVSAKTKAERNIVRLAQDCQEDAKELLDLLSGLKVTGRRRTVWRSLNAKWKSILKKDEVAKLKAQIQESRAEIQLNLSIILKEDQSTIGVQLKRIEDDCKGLISIDIPKQLYKIRDDLLTAMEEQSASISNETLQTSCLLSSIKQQLQHMEALLTTVPLQHRILRQLIFEDMGSRWSQILDADPHTCRWILEDDPDASEESESDSDSSHGLKSRVSSDVHSDSGSATSSSEYSSNSEWEVELIHREDTRNSFISWLTSGQDVLHISGNAGSGKSTLMKYIGQHKRTRRELKLWAGSQRLVFGQFYFWAAGTASQRTLPGLYRSLLFQTLSQCPELIEKIFPDQLAQMKSSGFQGDRAVEKLQGFDDAKIRVAFDLLLQHTQHANDRICFLIDGLDEFEGNRLDHENLAVKLRKWTIGGDVKLLVSSRPWTEFSNVFIENSTIQLHELNHFDIKTYCLGKLQEDREVRQLGNDHIVLKLKDVVKDIIDQSQGIFLWAHLVLDAVLQGIRQNDSITTLKAKVQEYPADLESLYAKLRDPVERSIIDRDRSNRLLLLAIKVPDGFPLTAVAFSWVLGDDTAGLLDPEFPTDTTCQPYSEDDVAQRLQHVTKQVNGLTRGLLRITRRPPSDNCLNGYFEELRITFSHRSARDYLVLNEARYKQLCASWPRFDDTDVYGRTHLAQLIYGVSLDDTQTDGTEDFVGISRYLHPGINWFCRGFDLGTIRKFEALLQPLLHPTYNNMSWVNKNASSCMSQSSLADLQVSFLQYAAWCSLDRYVLSEVMTRPPKDLHLPGSSILLACDFESFASPFILKLLDNHVSLDNMVQVKPPVDPVIAMPAWVILLLKVIDDTIVRVGMSEKEFGNSREYMASQVRLFRRLHEHSGRTGLPVSFSFQGKRPGKRPDGWTDKHFGGRPKKRPDGTEKVFGVTQFTSADVLQWVEGVYFREQVAALPSYPGTGGPAPPTGAQSRAHESETVEEEVQPMLDEWLEEYRCLVSPGEQIIWISIGHWNATHLKVIEDGAYFLQYRIF